MKLCRELSDLVVYTNSVAAQDIVDDGKDCTAFLSSINILDLFFGQKLINLFLIRSSAHISGTGYSPARVGRKLLVQSF